MNFARRHGIQGVDAAALARLRALSAAEIVDGGQERAGPDGPVTYSGPILDGRLTAETAQSAYEAGRQMRVPLIIGSNSADFVGFISAETKEALFSQFGERKAEAIAAYDPDGTADLRTLLVMAGTDRVQAEPARFTASAFVANGAPAYVYRFSYIPASMREQWRNGVPHGAEIPYAFDTLGAGFEARTPTPQDQAVARTVNTYWANFAKTGDPNGPGLPKWPRHDPRQERDPRVPARRYAGRRPRSPESAAGRDRAGRQDGEATLARSGLNGRGGVGKDRESQEKSFKGRNPERAI